MTDGWTPQTVDSNFQFQSLSSVLSSPEWISHQILTWSAWSHICKQIPHDIMIKIKFWKLDLNLFYSLLTFSIVKRDWTVLQKTTGLNNILSPTEYPFPWMIFICLTIVDFPDSPEPRSRSFISLKMRRLNFLSTNPNQDTLHTSPLPPADPSWHPEGRSLGSVVETSVNWRYIFIFISRDIFIVRYTRLLAWSWNHDEWRWLDVKWFNIC